MTVAYRATTSSHVTGPIDAGVTRPRDMVQATVATTPARLVIRGPFRQCCRKSRLRRERHAEDHACDSLTLGGSCRSSGERHGTHPIAAARIDLGPVDVRSPADAERLQYRFLPRKRRRVPRVMPPRRPASAVRAFLRRENA